MNHFCRWAGRQIYNIVKYTLDSFSDHDRRSVCPATEFLPKTNLPEHNSIPPMSYLCCYIMGLSWHHLQGKYFSFTGCLRPSEIQLYTHLMSFLIQDLILLFDVVVIVNIITASPWRSTEVWKHRLKRSMSKMCWLTGWPSLPSTPGIPATPASPFMHEREIHINHKESGGMFEKKRYFCQLKCWHTFRPGLPGIPSFPSLPVGP